MKICSHAAFSYLLFSNSGQFTMASKLLPGCSCCVTVGIGDAGFGEKLDGYKAVEARIAGFVDHTHATFTEQ